MAFRRIVPLVGVLTFALVTQVPAVAQSPSTEMELLRRVATQPAEISNYLDLAKVYMSGRRFDEAEQMLTRALALVRQARISPAIPNVTPFGASVRPAAPSAGDRMQPGVAPLRVGGDIKEPRKIKDVKPVYPEIARTAGVQGIVILEVVVGYDGAVTDAKLIRSVALLDQAALDAVYQWRFTPTLLNNVPVEVVMTVTVNFSLGM